MEYGAISLLSPDLSNKNLSKKRIPEATWNDLEVDLLLEKLFPIARERRFYTPFFEDMILDTDILRYRQEVIADFLESDDIFHAFKDLEPMIVQFRQFSEFVREEDSAVQALINKISELELYIVCIDQFRKVFNTYEPKSAALRRLKEHVVRISGEEQFVRLKEELPEIREKIRSCRSVSIGINLDNRLQPCEAAILGVHDTKFSYDKNPMIFGVFGPTAGNGEKPVTPLHTPPLKNVSNGKFSLELTPEDVGYAVDPLMIPLFKDLAQILKKTARPLLRQIQAYKSMAAPLFKALVDEIPVILSIVSWVREQKDLGLKFCLPEYDETPSRRFFVEGNFNPFLAEKLGTKVVCNTVNFREDGRFFLLTGPNQGGKSVYLQAVGLSQLLAQWGFPVPGEKALITIRDRILTHYPVQDKVSDEAGRLGEESSRLLELLKTATGDSLVLLNETFSTTHESEGMFLAEDVLTALLKSGISGILVTHIHSLADRLDTINAQNPDGARIKNLVALVTEKPDGTIVKTFKVDEGAPQGRSYASEIAAQYGLTRDNLIRILSRSTENQSNGAA